MLTTYGKLVVLWIVTVAAGLTVVPWGPFAAVVAWAVVFAAVTAALVYVGWVR